MALVFGPRGLSSQSSSPSVCLRSSIRPAAATQTDTAAVSAPSPVLSLHRKRAHRTTTSAHHQHKLSPPSPASPFAPPLNRIEAFVRDVALPCPLAPDGVIPEILSLLNVPPAAVAVMQDYLDSLACGRFSVAKRMKLDYDYAARSLAILACPGPEHEHMAGIQVDILPLINANSHNFTNNNPTYRIVSGGSTKIPLTNYSPSSPPLHRLPDGSLRLLCARGNPAFLVWEILDSQPLYQMQHKLRDYFEGTAGQVRVVIILQLQRQPPRPKPRKRTRRCDSLGDEGRAAPTIPGQDDPEDRDDQEIDDDAATDVDGPLSMPDTEGNESWNTPLDDSPRTPKTDTEGESDYRSLPLPAPGTIVRGLFWVYTHKPSTSPSGVRTITCLEKAQEFYPSCPTGSLQLTWENILGPTAVPRELREKVVCIPYQIFHDKLSELMLPEFVAPGEQFPDWDGLEAPGIEPHPVDSDPVSERSAVSDGLDESFVGVAGEATGERRKTRFFVREELASSAGPSIL